MRRRFLLIAIAIPAILGLGLLSARFSAAGRLKADLDAVTITVELDPPPWVSAGAMPAGTGLRSVVLDSRHARDPYAAPGLGEAVSANQPVTRAELAAVIDEFHLSGCLRRAEPYSYTQAQAPGESAPPGEDYREYQRTGPCCIIEVMHRGEGDEYRYLVMTLPWDWTTAALLRRLDARVPGPAFLRMARTIDLIPGRPPARPGE